MHDMPARFTPPPRRVPLSLRIVNLCNGLAQIGWVVFGLGMFFFWGFGANADLSFLTFRNPEGRAVGRVTHVAQTGASEDEQAIEAAHYQYSVAGKLFEGKSYSVQGSPAEGAEVTVEYDPADPSRSRIAGMRRALFPPGLLLIGIMPLAGVIVLWFATRTGLRRNDLLRDGVLTTGTLVRREPTNMYVNRRQVWALTFEFTDRYGKRQEATARTSITDRLEDERAEPLLYDPDDPSRVYLLDEAPARPRFDLNGEMAGSGIAALFALVIPALAVGVNALVAAFKLGLLRL